MTTYYCKCGREVKKSTKATTTGNRDTKGCTGCPYLLPYGPYKYVEGKGFSMDVQGHECRMTDHPANYTTHTSAAGGPNDKTVLHVESLDFDFLESITEWVHETFTEGELTGGFQRKALRAPEFMDGYRVTFYPSSNKKGVAAKQALFRRFFHPDGTRLDMTPEAEKAKVLADIEKSKEKKHQQSEGDCPFYAQRDYGDYQGGHFCHLCGSLKCKHRTCSAKYKDDWHECDVFKRYGGARRLAEMKREAKGEEMEKVYKDAKGVLYKIGSPGGTMADKTTVMVLDLEPGSKWHRMKGVPQWPLLDSKAAQQYLDTMAVADSMEEATEEEIQYNLFQRAELMELGKDEQLGMTEDEINAALCDKMVLTSKKRDVVKFFEAHPDEDTAADFLRRIYGTGSCDVHAGQEIWNANFDDSGLRLAKSGSAAYTPDVSLSWAEVAHYVADLVDEGEYLDTEEQANYQQWINEQKQQDKPQECTPDEIQKIIKYIPTGWAYQQAFAEVCSKAKDRENLNALLRCQYCDLMFNRDNLFIDHDNTLKCTHDTAGVFFYAGPRRSYLPFPEVLDMLWDNAKASGMIESGKHQEEDENESVPLSSLSLSSNCLRILDDFCVETADDLETLLDFEIEQLKETVPEDWVKIESFLSSEKRELVPEKQPEVENPTSVATAAGEEPVESPEPVALTPTTETAVATSEQADDAATPAPALGDMPAEFDYSGLDIPTVDTLHWAERRIKEARSKYITDVAEAVAIVHDELVRNSDEHNNQYSEDTFAAWCKYIGLSKSTAYQLLQVNQLLTSSTPEEAAQLEQASPSLLYAAAKPSAPAELVQAVKDGDITTHKQYQEAIARIKTLEDQNKQLKHENEMERKEQEDANASAMHYKAECDRRAEDQRRLEGLVETANQKADLAAKKSAEAWEQVAVEKKARKKAEAQTEEIQQMYDTDMPEMQRFIDKAQAERDEYKALLESGQQSQLTATVTEVDQDEINRRAQQIAEGMMAEKMNSLEAGYPLEDAAYDLSEIFSARWDNAQMFTREIRTRDDWTAIRTLQETLADMVKALDEMLGAYEEV